MRFTILSALAALWLSAPAAAFEIEEETIFGDGPVLISVLSTTDTGVFAPLIAAYQAQNPDVSVRYVVANSQEVYRAIHDEAAAFDLVISSAMDLQMKLANDGFGRAHDSDAVAALPRWARWRDQLFAVTQEPVVMVASRAGFDGLGLPQTRAELVQVLRDHPERFAGRVGTYDPVRSGAGYLFATQDARQSDTSWRLAEVMGRLDPQLYTASSDMITAIQNGELALAYNVVGPYAQARLAGDPDAVVILPEDFTHVLLRTALIPTSGEAPDLGRQFLDFLLSEAGQQLLSEAAGLPRISAADLADGPALRPIRLDPGLLVFVDPIMRRRFLDEWTAAVVQP